ncbi:MAG: Flp pilus assembly protein CpaB [Chloroflexi bacterium]|nr:Flp pilus assembly protein CpaB [Chloroflexota bacterium]
MSVLEHVVKRPGHKMVAMDAEATASEGVLWVRNRAGKMVALPVGMGDLPATRSGNPEALGASSLAPSIPAGMRAVTVAFAEGVGSGGPLVPGDHIDIIATFTKEVMGKDQAVVLLQDVLVLALTQGASPGEQSPGGFKARLAEARRALAGSGAEDGPAAPTARTITLAVTPEAVQRLALAEDLGRLRYALRGAGEEESAPATAMSVRQLLRRRPRPAGRGCSPSAEPADPAVAEGSAQPASEEAPVEELTTAAAEATTEALALVAPDEASPATLAVAPGSVAMVTLDVAHVRSEPSLASRVIGEAEYGDELEVLGRRADWLKVRLPDEREGWVAGGWIAGVKRERGDEDVSP